MKLSKDAETLRATLGVQIRNMPGGVIELHDLQQMAGVLAPIIAPGLLDHEVREVIDRLMDQYNVVMQDGYGVIDKLNFQPWLTERKKISELPRSAAYQELLIQRGWAGGVIDALDRQTDRIMDLTGDPQRLGSWARRGIAIGEVQSGKTSTYIGVLAKAIDYGFKVIIVIGGHTEDLRRQTQSRLDSDLTGIDSSYLSENIASNDVSQIGIGKIDKHLPMSINVLTTTQSDFSASNKRAGKVALGAGTPTIFVVKKNKSVLNNLAQYLSAAMPKGGDQPPLLLIDDEADWASINTNDETNVTAVNAAIRKLLEQSNRNSYLGITATPFANIFINDDVEKDLFPRDFIQVLQSPSNYQGVSEYFGEGVHGALVEDVQDTLKVLPYNHKSSVRIYELPVSLRRAIVSFFIGTAIRRIRDGYARPAAMLINVSRFKAVQGQVFKLAQEYVAELAATIMAEFGMEEGSRTSELADFIRDTYAGVYADVDVTWMSVRTELVGVSEELRAVLINGETKADRDRWLVQTPRRVKDAVALIPTIYVGGDVLARGLTLDGLQISYYARRASAADTLLQMGRWFGYRPGYEDLVRLWIDPLASNLFRWTADLSQELRDSLAEMEAKELTPLQFGLKMRRHPEGFLIASAKKMQHAQSFEGLISLNSKMWESHMLDSDAVVRAQNLQAMVDLVEALGDAAEASDKKTLIWRDIPADVVGGFLSRFRAHAGDLTLGARPGGISPIATSLSDIKGSDRWDIAMMAGRGEEISVDGLPPVPASVRNTMYVEGDQLRFTNRRVAAGADLLKTLAKDERDELQRRRGDSPISDHQVRDVLQRPVLMLYLAIASNADGSEIGQGKTAVVADAADPIAAIVVAPPTLTAEEEQEEIVQNRGVRWVINRVYARHELGWEDEDAEDEE